MTNKWENLKSTVTFFIMFLLITYVCIHDLLFRKDDMNEIYKHTEYNEEKTLTFWHRNGNWIFNVFVVLCVLSAISGKIQDSIFPIVNLFMVMNIIFEIYRVFQIQELRKQLRSEGINVKIGWWDLYGLFFIFGIILLITLSGIIKFDNFSKPTYTIIFSVTYLIVITLFITYNSMTSYRLHKLQRIIDDKGLVLGGDTESKLNFGWIFLSTNVIDLCTILLLLLTLGLGKNNDKKYIMGILSLLCLGFSGIIFILRRFIPVKKDKETLKKIIKQSGQNIKDPVKAVDNTLSFFHLLCAIFILSGYVFYDQYINS